MNVKQATDVLNLTNSWIYTKARRLGIPKVRGQYDLTDKDIEKIKNLPKLPYKRLNRAEMISKETGIGVIQITSIAHRLKLSMRKDYHVILYICQEWKTGFYTYKGLRNLLKYFK
jgi:hypothetical protein